MGIEGILFWKCWVQGRYLDGYLFKLRGDSTVERWFGHFQWIDANGSPGRR